MDSQDRRSAFEPRLGQSYTYDDPITGDRDKVGDENFKIKLFVASSITQGEAVIGNSRGDVFLLSNGSMVVYKDDGSAVTIS